MKIEPCVYCGKNEREHGNGWRSVTCTACAAIVREDTVYNQYRIKQYHRAEITIEELRAGYRNRIKEIYFKS
jgi:hypothetical protein